MKAVSTSQKKVTGLEDIRARRGLPQIFLLLALVPAEPWEAPARLGFCGYDGCPWPSEHRAVPCRWNDQCGLRTATVTEGVLEFEVARLPRTVADALLLATELFGYCPYIVYQGFETVPKLAAYLFRNRMWQFWWD